MKSEKSQDVAVIATLLSGFGMLIFSVPLLLTLGLWLLGVPLDWSSWKTYAGIAAFWLAVIVA